MSLARKRRQLTAKGVAELAGLNPNTITRIERGDNTPDDETINKLSRALGFPVPFFFEDDPVEIDTEAVSFRSFSKMSVKQRDAALSAGTIGLQLSEWIADRFTLPSPDLIDLSYETKIEVAARSLRQHWSLGERPIGNLVALLEAKGVRVFSLAENTASVNAFSFWQNETPFVFLNNFKTAESSIFDAAHELGHLVLHKHAGRKSSKNAEREADAFASSFLMPADDVLSRMPRRINVSTILMAKKRWRVSAMAMAFRLHKLGAISDWQYKSACIELGKRGYRSREPDGIEREKSVVWTKIFSQLWSERLTKNDIAAALNLPLDELEGVLWGLAGQSRQSATGSTGLKIV